MKMKKRLLYYAIATYAALLLSIHVSAQNAIKGQLRSANGEPLNGATIFVKGTNKSVTTDEKGAFTLDVPIGSTLVVSYVGYTTREIKVLDQSTLNVQLQPSAAQDLQQVVVVGYGTQQKKDLTGAI